MSSFTIFHTQVSYILIYNDYYYFMFVPLLYHTVWYFYSNVYKNFLFV